MFGRLWVEIGCRDVLRRHLADCRFGFDAERAIYLTVLHRLMVSGSDRHASTWQHSVHIPGADAPRRGRPSLPPGRYFRMLLIGYFEGIDSERGLEWRCADSLSLVPASI